MEFTAKHSQSLVVPAQSSKTEARNVTDRATPNFFIKAFQKWWIF
jgi:hypothetical protein